MQEYIKAMLLSEESKLTAFMKPQALKDLYTHFVQGTAKEAGISRYQLYQRLFMLLSLEIILSHWKVSLN